MRPPGRPQGRRFEFTKKGVEVLPAHNQDSPSREAEYADSACVGLHLRVSKAGRKFFQHRYRFLGRKKCLTIGEFPGVSVQDARQLVNEHKGLLARSRDPAAEKSRARAELTFAEFADKHYLPHARAHKATWDDDKAQVEKRLCPSLGTLRLSAITARDVALVHAKEKERTSACNANHLLATLKRMLTLACKWGMLEKNPATYQERFKEGPLRERYLSKEELPRFLKALEEQDDRLSVAAIRLLLFTGCRREEVLSLRWENVHRGEERFFLPKTKTGRSRTVHLNAAALGVVDDLLTRRESDARTRGSDYVFPSRGGAKKPYIYDLRKPFERACQAAGVENFRLHDLRHSFASMAVSAGAGLYEVQRLLGHADISMTQRYAHLAADDLKRATASVAAVVEQAAAG